MVCISADQGLGYQPKGVHYGISGRSEAAAYAVHPVLGARLLEGVGTVLEGPEPDLNKLFGLTDATKFRSCLTLFERFEPTAQACRHALLKFYGGKRDQATVETGSSPI